MEKVIQCECGFEARGEDEDGLVAEVQRHAREAHGMALTPEQALLLVFRADLDGDGASRKPVGEALHDASQDVMSDFKEEE